MSDFTSREKVVPAQSPKSGGQGGATSNMGRGDLRSMTFSEGESALKAKTSGGADTSFLTDLFARIDQNRDKGIDRNEVIAHLKRVGIGGGLFGIVHKKVSTQFMEQLDTNKDEKVTWDEFHAVASQVMPAEIFDEKGQVRPELVDQVFAAMDLNKDGGVSREEIEKTTLAKLPEDTSFKDTIAEVASKLGVDALDLNKDGKVTKAELLAAARAVAALAKKHQ
jgi:Ca2+-binding EF-hand superfamily protein